MRAVIGSVEYRSKERKELEGPGGRTVSGAAEGRAGGRKSKSVTELIRTY